MMINIHNQRHLASNFPSEHDLTGYEEEIKSQFEERANDLRRIFYSNQFIHGNPGRNHNGFNSFSRSRSLNSLSSYFHGDQSLFSPSSIITIFKEYNNEISVSKSMLSKNEQINSILDGLINSSEEIDQNGKSDFIDRCLLIEISNDENIVNEAIQIYLNFINYVLSLEDPSNLTEEFVFMFVRITQLISIIFKWGEVEIQNLISDELTISFNMILSLPHISDLSLILSTSESFKTIIKSILIIIILFAQKSEYTRNCLVCFGVQSTINENITNIMNTVINQLRLGNDILGHLNSLSDLDVEILNMSCFALCSIFSHLDKFDGWEIGSILDSFIDLIQIGVQDDESGESDQITQLLLTNCFSNGRRSVPFIIKKTAIECLTYITNHKNSKSAILCQKGIHTTLLRILKMSFDFFFQGVFSISDQSQFRVSSLSQSQIPTAFEIAGSNWGSFVSSILKLIGNTASSQQKASIELLENGLIPMLMNLIQLKNCCCSDCTHSPDNGRDFNPKNCQSFVSCAFWILSNLLTIIPEILVPIIPLEFIQFSLAQVSDAPIGIKREVACFLATCVLCFSYERISAVFSSDNDNGTIFFELMDEMISSGRNDIAIRCIDAMINIILMFVNDNSNETTAYIANMIDESEILKDVEVLMEAGDPRLADHAKALHNQANRLFSFMNC